LKDEQVLQIVKMVRENERDLAQYLLDFLVEESKE
jgi:hypothetical protein